MRELSEGRELEAILGITLAKRGGYSVPELDVTKYQNFVALIQKGYKNITYHNMTHAADLCQSMNYFMVNGTVKTNELESFAMLTAAVAHDFEHPGVNNIFLKKI